MEWQDIDEKVVCVTSNVEQLAKISEKNLLCINGSMIDKVVLFETTAP